MSTAYVTRAALEDAGAIAAIYNQGIEDRVAAFETEPRSAADMAARFQPGTLFVVAEAPERGIVAFAISLQLAALLCRHRRILGLRGAELSEPRRRARSTKSADSSR